MTVLKELTEAVELMMAQPVTTEEDIKNRMTSLLSMVSDLIDYLAAQKDDHCMSEPSLRVVNGGQVFGRNAITFPGVERGAESSE